VFPVGAAAELLGQVLDPDRGGDQPGDRVGGTPDRRVEWHQPAQPRRRLGEQLRGVVDVADPGDELVASAHQVGRKGHAHGLQGPLSRPAPKPLE
jgi:hypothetical protein